MLDWIFDHLLYFIGGAILAAVGAVALYIVLLLGSQSTVTFTVNDRLSKGSSGTYLIYTNKGVFADEDSVLKRKFNSSDVFNQLKPHHTYTCSTMGWRVPIFSWYRNVISCHEA